MERTTNTTENILFLKDVITSEVVAVFPDNEYDNEVLAYSPIDGYFRTSLGFLSKISDKAKKSEYAKVLSTIRQRRKSELKVI